MTTRTFTVTASETDRPLARFLSDHLQLTRAAVERLIRASQVRVDGLKCVDPNRPLSAGQTVIVDLEPRPAKKSAPGAAQPIVVFADVHLLVVNKPPGLTTMRHAHETAEFGERGKRFLPQTLQDLLTRMHRTSVRAVHRLDNETSGLIVFAPTPAAESNLGRQFRAHSTERLYRALVRGKPREGRIESWLARDRGDGRRGSGPADMGQRAVTHVRIVESLGAFSLVECRLETGRTHQVRIHLGEAGRLCGEHVYDRPINGKPLPDGSDAVRVMLHAATLGFDHPATGERVRWDARLPADMEELLRRLRRTM